MCTNTFILSAIALAATASAASANSYRGELNVGGGSSEIEYEGFSEADKSNYGIVSGTYYFSDVATRNHPLAEAAFLERSSGISFTYSRDRTRFEDVLVDTLPNGDAEIIGEGRFTTTSTFSSADIEFYIPNSIFYIGGGIGEGTFKTRYRVTDGDELITGSYSEDTGTFWSLRAGITPVDGLLVWSEFYKDQEVDDEWNINAKYVMDLSGNALNLEASYDHFYGNDSLGLAADFYFDRTFSLGATYTYYDDTNANDDYGLRLRKFFTDKFAVETSFVTSDIEDSYLVGATLRF
jgi:hypothetical protein